jgi:cytochrome subunit of sulfide dehydrogenase
MTDPHFRAACRSVLLSAALLASWPALAQSPVATDPNLARNLAATCANCHGTHGNARGDMKPIAGVSAEKLLAMLDDYRSGNQPATIMHQIVKGYTPEQLKLIAGHFAAQQPKK